MLTDLFDEDEGLREAKAAANPTFQQQKSEYPQKRFGGNKFPPKAPISEEPYVPIVFFVEREYPSEIKDEIYILIDKALNKGYTVRLNGDDKEFVERVQKLNSKKVEIYIPWRGFNEIESKYYFNPDPIKNIAKQYFPPWDKIPQAVQAILTRNVRMVFGDKNNSLAACVVLYTPDGSSRISEVTRETGRNSFFINMSGRFGISIINLKKSKLVELFITNYGL